MSAQYAQWAIDIPLTINVAGKNVDTRIRQACQIFDVGASAVISEREMALGLLLGWARKHEAHPELLEYAQRSYLPEPDNFTPQMTDEEFAARGIKVTREVRPCLAPLTD